MGPARCRCCPLGKFLKVPSRGCCVGDGSSLPAAAAGAGKSLPGEAETARPGPDP